MTPPLISVENLTVRFRTDEGLVTAVDGVSFDIAPGEVLGLVGESGSGKSVTAKSLMLLNADNTVYDPASRMVFNDGDKPIDILSLKRPKDRMIIRGGAISMIFQEPMASFAPAITIGDQMVEQLLLHSSMSKAQAKDISVEMLARVGIPDPAKRFSQYAFEFSGGMRQRAMIAMALSTKPKLLIADEPTTALDVTIQAQVIDLMKDLVDEFHMGILFITHDLGVIAQTADRVAVMYLGNIVENGSVRQVIKSPAHPYTQGLLNALPNLEDLESPLTPVPGDIPSPLERPSGCVFNTRCPQVIAGRCDAAVPPMVAVEDTHNAACYVTADLKGELRMSAAPKDKPVIAARDLAVHFPLGRSLFGTPPVVRAVEGVNLDIPRGSFFGLVGESGSGKTTLGRALLHAVPVSRGHVSYDDGEVQYDLAELNKPQLKDYRKRAQLIFQDPYAALSPRMTVRDIIAEPLEVMGLTKSREETDERVRDIAAKCRLNLEHLRRFPHAFSGGQRQRISIARALVCNPRFIVADESVAALDVSIQADVLNLLRSLQDELGLTFLFISHDLSVVAHTCDHVAVMYLGRLVESGPTRTLFSNPRHPYTQALLSAIPSLDPDQVSTAQKLEGEIPSPANPPPGCKFQTRCPHATDFCRTEEPALDHIGDEHEVACHYWKEVSQKALA